MNRWVNRSFGRRIAAFFIPITIVLIITIAGISSQLYYRSLMNSSQKNIKGIVKQGSYIIDLYFQDVKTTAVLLSCSEEILYMLNQYDSMSKIEWLYGQEEVDKVLRNTSLMRDYIQDCIIVGYNGYQTNMPDHSAIKNGYNIMQEDWMAPILEEKRGFVYTAAHEANYYYGIGATDKQVLSVVLPVVQYGKNLGYIIINLDFHKMQEIVNAGNKTGNLNYLVTDQAGQIIFSDNNKSERLSISQEDIRNMTDEEAFFLTVDGRELFCVHEASSTTKWEFIGFIEKKEIIRPMMQFRNILIFIIFPVFILVTVISSIMITRRVKKPLEELVEQLDQIDVDHPKSFSVTNSVGEMEYLAGKITDMSQKIIRLVEDMYKTELKYRDAQMEVLLSQINPHFLYNTLQLIKTESAKGDSRSVSETVNCLSGFLRYTINNRETYVPVSKELEHIRIYMEIYKKRFPGKFSLEVEQDQNMDKILIPKFILQPVVENAIKHGLRNTEQAVIRVTVKNERDLLIQIRDNGIGMEKSECDRLFQKLHSQKQTGDHVGLFNIQERLEMEGGEEYGIVKIESSPGEGFAVTLKVKKENEDVQDSVFG
ncbi:MAG: histidine kinase [Lachnospiraceae bacterium]|nr:histidine kinase [Lachnospiraceae bacterium]